MVKLYIIIFALVFAFAFEVNANSTPPVVNLEAIQNIEENLLKLDEVLRDITSQVEKNTFEQKQMKKDTIILIKTINLDIADLKTSQIELEKQLSKYNAEINTEFENLANIVAMMQEQLKQQSKIIATIATESPKSLVEIDEVALPENKEIEKDTALISEETDEEKKLEQNSTSDKDNVKEEALLVDSVVKTGIVEETEIVDTKNEEKIIFDVALDLYNKKDYEKAVIKFADNVKAFPTGGKFYKNLMYIGLALDNMDIPKNEVCSAFYKIINSKETIDKDIIEESNEKFDELKCKQFYKE